MLKTGFSLFCKHALQIVCLTHIIYIAVRRCLGFLAGTHRPRILETRVLCYFVFIILISGMCIELLLIEQCLEN